MKNGERTLEKCLDPLIDQTFRDFEIVIVDNWSTDGTFDIIERFEKKDQRVRSVREDRIGRGPARNRGVKEAVGEIICWTDADCVVPKDWIERITKPIRETDHDIVQGNEEAVASGFWSREAQKAGQRHIGSHVDGATIDHIDTKNLALRSSVLKEIGGFDQELLAMEDFDLKIRLKKKGYSFRYLNDLRVKHHHREDLRSLYRSRVEQGYWAGVIYLRNRDFFDAEEKKDNTIGSMYPSDIVKFPIHLAFFLPRNGISSFIFEAATGIFWRIGNIKGRLAHRRMKKGE
ncbi:MAG: glycosyltransferase [Candidatus Thermoplasmatota archaeon]|nr:glycosyltransferase [Candidatus Thermoplasmatota archaeon]